MICITAASSTMILIPVLLCSHGAKAQSPQEDIVLIDEIRMAFYEPAPRSLARAMSRAVASWCASGSGAAASDSLSWLSNGDELTYFRSVYVTGHKGAHGLVCEDSHIEYYGMDLVAESVAAGSCVEAGRYNDSEYELYVGDVEQ